MATTPTRSMRIPDQLWHDAVLIAAGRSESVTEIVVARLERYVKQHAHLLDQEPADR